MRLIAPQTELEKPECEWQTHCARDSKPSSITPSGSELSQVMVHVNLQQFSPLFRSHLSEHRVGFQASSVLAFESTSRIFSNCDFSYANSNLCECGILKPVGSHNPTGCSGYQSTRIHLKSVLEIR